VLPLSVCWKRIFCHVGKAGFSPPVDFLDVELLLLLLDVDFLELLPKFFSEFFDDL